MFEEPGTKDLQLTYGAATSLTRSGVSDWFSTADSQLVSTITRNSMAGAGIGPDAIIQQLHGLSGIEITLYCGAKSAFGAAGGPVYTSVEDTPSPNFRECLEEGYQNNARIRAAEPQKLYFPDEVVVVATFAALEAPKCAPQAGSSTNDVLCDGAFVEANLAGHLDQSDMELSGFDYMGMRSGNALPRGIPREVVLRPEDVLEAVSLLDRERRLQDGESDTRFRRATCPR